MVGVASALGNSVSMNWLEIPFNNNFERVSLAFCSFGYGYLRIVDRNRVFVYQKPIQKEFYKIGNLISMVYIKKYLLGSNGKFIYCSIKSVAKGIVLEGAGRGHIPPQAVEAVYFAIAHGVKIVLTTSCEEGEVFPIYDFAGGVRDRQDRIEV